MQLIQPPETGASALLGTWPRGGAGTLGPGDQVVVDDGRKAVVLVGGEPFAVFGPGQHELKASQLPAGDPAPEVVVAFVSTEPFTWLKWGTREPIELGDDESGVVGLRAYGRLALRIARPRRFAGLAVGDLALRTTDALEARLRDLVVGRLAEVLAAELSSLRDLPERYEELCETLESRVGEDLSEYGVEVMALVPGAMVPPPAVRRQVESRSGEKMRERMEAWARRRVSEVEEAAGSPD